MNESEVDRRERANGPCRFTRLGSKFETDATLITQDSRRDEKILAKRSPYSRWILARGAPRSSREIRENDFRRFRKYDGAYLEIYVPSNYTR